MTDFSSKAPEILNPTKQVHPYRDVLEKTLAKQKNLLFYLEEKLKCIDKKYPETLLVLPDQPNYHDFVDAQISRIKTEGEIEITRKVIEEKQKYFDSYTKQFEIDSEDVRLHYKNVVAMAHKSTKPEVKKILETVIWERVEEDDEKRIALYKQLKKYI